MVTRKHCKWGVVLFNLPKNEGLWIEGSAFDEKVLTGREKVNSSVVREARRNHVGHVFSESKEFIEIIRHPPKTPGKPYLVPQESLKHNLRNRSYSGEPRFVLSKERVASDLVFADLVFLLVDLPGLQVHLHPILLALQIVLIAAARSPGTENTAKKATPH
jgi:hypothetical protein